MKLRAILLLGAAAAVATFSSGCATQTAMGKTHTSVLGGLVDYQEGTYSQTSPTSIPVVPKKPDRVTTMTGNRISFLWGLITYSDQ